MRSPLAVFTRVVCLLALTLFAWVPAAHACCSGGGDIIIFDHGDSLWIIVDCGRSVAVSEGMNACSAGVRYDPSVLASVDHVSLVNPYTLMPLEGLSFAANARTSRALQRMAPLPGFEWVAFYGEPQQSFVGGIHSDLHIDARLAPGKTAEDLKAMLEKGGLIINGSADLNGKPNFNHIQSSNGATATIYR
jgi:hypothetical protein